MTHIVWDHSLKIGYYLATGNVKEDNPLADLSFEDMILITYKGILEDFSALTEVTLPISLFCFSLGFYYKYI